MALAKILAEGEAREPSRPVVLNTLLIEGEDIPQHPQIVRREQIGALCEQPFGGVKPIIAAAFPFKAALIGGDGEAHAAFDSLDAELGEQRRQLRVVELVVNDEADIDVDV